MYALFAYRPAEISFAIYLAVAGEPERTIALRGLADFCLTLPSKVQRGKKKPPKPFVPTLDC